MMGFRLMGGRPKSMDQGIYWVQRHRDDQKRNASAQASAAAKAQRERTASLKAVASEQRALARWKQEVEAGRQLEARWNHFSKIQAELGRAMSLIGNDIGENRFQVDIELEEGSVLHKQLTEAHTIYQEHAEAINDSTISLSTRSLSRHLQNSKNFLTVFGRASGLKPKWSAQEKRLAFGDIELDFSAPTQSSPDERLP